MPRGFPLSTVAHVVACNEKWLDNFLTHNNIEGVTQNGRGVSRSLSPHAVIHVYLARILVDQLGATAAAAAQVAARLLHDGKVTLSQGVEIQVDINILTEVVNERILDGVQFAPARQRGRPPKAQRD